MTNLCHNLDYTTTDCSVLLIVVLLKGKLQQHKVPASSILIYNGTMTNLQQKCHNLDYTTTDCSILLIVVLLKGKLQQLKVPASSILCSQGSRSGFPALSTTNCSTFYNKVVVLLSKYYFQQYTTISRTNYLLSKTENGTRRIVVSSRCALL